MILRETRTLGSMVNLADISASEIT